MPFVREQSGGTDSRLGKFYSRTQGGETVQSADITNGVVINAQQDSYGSAIAFIHRDMTLANNGFPITVIHSDFTTTLINNGSTGSVSKGDIILCQSDRVTVTFN